MSFSIGTNRIFHLPMISAKRYLLPYNYLTPLSATNLIWHIDKCVEHFGKIRSTRETNQVPWSAALLCHTCLGCSTEWWVAREDLPKSPPLRSSSGLQLRVRAPGSSSSPTTGKQRQVQPSIPAGISPQKNQKKDLKDSVSRTGLKRENWRIGSIQICSF